MHQGEAVVRNCAVCETKGKITCAMRDSSCYEPVSAQLRSCHSHRLYTYPAKRRLLHTMKQTAHLLLLVKVACCFIDMPAMRLSCYFRHLHQHLSVCLLHRSMSMLYCTRDASESIIVHMYVPTTTILSIVVVYTHAKFVLLQLMRIAHLSIATTTSFVISLEANKAAHRSASLCFVLSFGTRPIC